MELEEERRSDESANPSVESSSTYLSQYDPSRDEVTFSSVSEDKTTSRNMEPLETDVKS